MCSLIGARHVSVYPAPQLGRLARRAKPFDVALRAFTSLHVSGRAALYYFFKVLRLNPLETVWMPSFHCGVEVQAALDCGLQVQFYPLNSQLQIDFNRFLQIWSEHPGHVLVIHYFGIEQEALKILVREVHARKLLLIEDCAHALYSQGAGYELGSVGAAAIYSLRKTLPIFEGGALRVNKTTLSEVGYAWSEYPALEARSPRSWLEATKAEFIQLVGSHVVDTTRKWLGKPAIHPDVLTAPSLAGDKARDQRMSSLSRSMACRADPANVAERRRRNYSDLAAILRKNPDYNPLFPEVGPYVCPLCLPIVVKDRPYFLRILHRAGINPYVFGAYAHPLLPPDMHFATEWMRNQIVGLPVHQELTATDLEAVARAVSTALTGANNPKLTVPLPSDSQELNRSYGAN